MKDVNVSIHPASIKCVALGKGQMAPYLSQFAEKIKKMNYKGAISLESVYRPKNGNFEDGFHSSITLFKELFS